MPRPKRKKVLESSITSLESSGASEKEMEYEKLLKRRTRAKAEITRINEFFVNSENDDTVDINEYSTREARLVKAFENYLDIQNLIEDENESEEQDRIELEKDVCTLQAKYKSKIQKLLNSSFQNINFPQQNNEKNSAANLPKISIPIFSGKYDEWQAYFDLFCALIHDKSDINTVQKFMYLKTSLKGEASSLVSDLPLTNANYQVAIDLLKKRYDNKLMVINTHLKKMFESPSLTKSDSHTLRQFITNIKQNLNSLEALKLPVDSWDIILVYLFSKKLDFQTQKAFELEKCSTELPTLKEFFNFLEKRCQALENLSVRDYTVKTKVHFVQKENSKEGNSSSNDNRHCLVCKQDNHNIYKCYKFKGFTISEKRDFIKTNNLCYNCLASGHGVQQCTSSGCRTCNGRHHSLLHVNKGSRGDGKDNSKSFAISARGLNPRANQGNGENSTSISNSGSNLNTRSNYNVDEGNPTNKRVQGQDSEFNSNQIEQGRNSTSLVIPRVMQCNVANTHILLATAIVLVSTSNGKKVTARALLDSASQTTFINAKLFKKLGHPGFKQKIQIGGITNTTTEADQYVRVNIESKNRQGFNINATCVVLEKITCPLPQVVVDTTKFEIPLHIDLADPNYYLPSQIDMLIGADLYFNLLQPGLINLGIGLPVLQNSCLGYLIGGQVPTESVVSNVRISLFSKIEELNELLPKFWQIEEVQNERFLSPEDTLAENIFASSTFRLEDGSFQIDLPMRNNSDYTKLGKSFNIAARRFFWVRKKELLRITFIKTIKNLYMNICRWVMQGK
ncbi:hypothetical protein NQ317_000038 [Molorchus minor]|uniref:Peptidase aspartic putative domain-containing protein n=1 Tax=Molorchus minor TaxID=1323400 RepID=A0ABQ9JGX1_9CUCU|nr:hypothetical protein NQ317_000038 [Molorchus minor]